MACKTLDHVTEPDSIKVANQTCLSSRIPLLFSYPSRARLFADRWGNLV